MTISSEYHGFEQGPIRPPSEAYSLLVRVTRNCPWNRCTFCPLYKGSRFSIRKVEHVKKDIDLVYRYVEALRQMGGESGRINRIDANKIAENINPVDQQAFFAALNWFNNGMSSIFIQDANSLFIRSSDMAKILTYIKKRFPWIERITSYARSHTIARIKDADLNAIRDAGLSRIHIGLESGSDLVLKMVNKGATKETHIKAGIKVKNAGMELSEYIMPGLGGRRYSDIHALETADALNRINPDFIRIRTLAIPGNIPLFEDYTAGRFEKCSDIMTANEILMFIEKLKGITSIIKSDHILNLFEEVEGAMPEDKEYMLSVIRSFQSMNTERRCLYQVGRRLGLFHCLGDVNNGRRMAKVEKICHELGVTSENVDETIDELMKRFI
jgi:histone acetyltransferase (RNA polymerase elongator complex component)